MASECVVQHSNIMKRQQSNRYKEKENILPEKHVINKGGEVIRSTGFAGFKFSEYKKTDVPEVNKELIVKI